MNRQQIINQAKQVAKWASDEVLKTSQEVKRQVASAPEPKTENVKQPPIQEESPVVKKQRLNYLDQELQELAGKKKQEEYQKKVNQVQAQQTSKQDSGLAPISEPVAKQSRGKMGGAKKKVKNALTAFKERITTKTENRSGSE